MKNDPKEMLGVTSTPNYCHIYL